MLSLYFKHSGMSSKIKKSCRYREWNHAVSTVPGSSPMELKVNFSEILSYDASALLIVQFPKF